jgi:hypothetical protein
MLNSQERVAESPTIAAARVVLIDTVADWTYTGHDLACRRGANSSSRRDR